MRWLRRRQFKSRNPEIREETLNALSANAGPNDIRLFAKAMLDEHPDVRRAANRAIGLIPLSSSQKCIKMLLPWLTNRNFTTRKSAALALQALGWSPNTSKENALYLIAIGNFDEIDADESAVEPLLNTLKIGSIITKCYAAQALERIQLKMQDPRIVGPLLDALKNPEANLRAAAARALGNSNDNRKIGPLLNAFKDSVPTVRVAAVEAIGKLGNADYVKNFSPLLKDSSFEVRVAVIAELARTNAPEVFEMIVPALKDSDCDVRKRAVESLGKLRDPRSIGALILTLIDPEKVVRHGAANVLQTIDADWTISKEAQAAIPRLEASLNDSEYWVRESAAKALYRIRNS